MKYCPPFSVGSNGVIFLLVLLCNLRRAHLTKYNVELADGHPFRSSFVYGHAVFLCAHSDTPSVSIDFTIFFFHGITEKF